MATLRGLSSCARCDLSQTRQRVVIGSGPATPKVLILGEAPGRAEDEGGEPFIGRSGKLLFRLLEEEAGITRAECFVTNVVKCRPPENRTPTASERAACRPWLDKQFALLSPQLIVCVGNSAGREVFGYREPLRDVRGSVFAVGAVPGLVTFHPAAALRGAPNVEAMMREDFRHVGRLVASR